MESEYNRHIIRKNLKNFNRIIKNIHKLTIINSDVIVTKKELHNKFISLILNYIEYINKKSLTLYEVTYDIIYVTEDVTCGIRIDYSIYNQNLKKYILVFSYDIIFDDIIISNKLNNFFKWLDHN